MNRGGDLPVTLAQNLLHLAIKIGVNREALEAPVGLNGHQEPVKVAERLVHVGLFDLDIAHVNGRIALDDATVGILADHLRVDDGILRDVDDQVAEDLGRAGQPAAGLEIAFLGVAHLVAAEGRDVLVGRGDAMLGEDTFLHIDLAAPADAAAAADTLDMHAQLPRGIEHRRVCRETAALARGHEQDEMVGHVWVMLRRRGLRGHRGGVRRLRRRELRTAAQGRSLRYAAGSPCRS
jgi:hypothetical protein